MAESLIELYQAIRARRMATDEADLGLRERKKRLLRQQISDTATAMFLDRGFDGVRVSEVAEACSVSEKTVYNYFPTKESLLLDREDEMAESLRRRLGPDNAAATPVEAMVEMILGQVSEFTGFWEEAGQPDMIDLGRFTDLMESTPSLRAAQMDMTERLARVAAQAMAERAGVDPDDPEPQIAGEVMMGLWRLFMHQMRRHAIAGHAPAEVRRLVEVDLQRAARVVDSGLWSFGLAAAGTRDAEAMRRGAQASEEAARQVVRTVREARRAWRQAAGSGEAMPTRQQVVQARRELAHAVRDARRARRS